MKFILEYLPFAKEDWVQIVSITFAILLGAAPNFFSIRKKDDKKYTVFGLILIPVFFITLFFSVISTLANISSNNDLKISTKELVDSVKSTIYNLRDLQSKTKSILDNFDELQKQSSDISISQNLIRNSSDSILEKLKSDQKKTKENDSLTLRNVIFKLERNTNETTYLPLIRNSVDSLQRVNLYKNYLKSVLLLMESQNLNSFLLLNNDLKNIWYMSIQSINQIVTDIEGYGGVKELPEFIINLNRFFRNLRPAYEEEMETGNKKIKDLKRF